MSRHCKPLKAKCIQDRVQAFSAPCVFEGRAREVQSCKRPTVSKMKFCLNACYEALVEVLFPDLVWEQSLGAEHCVKIRYRTFALIS